MSSKFSAILCILTIWTIDIAQSASTHHAPPPSADCSNVLLNMADCLSFVTNGSNITKPEGSCCSGLKSVLKTSPICLCEVFKNNVQLGIAFNVTKAITLPAACNVSAPSVTKCGLSESPASAPAGGLSPQSSATSPTSSGAASGLNAPVNEPSSVPAPSPGNIASGLFPISVGTLLVCLLVTIILVF